MKRSLKIGLASMGLLLSIGGMAQANLISNGSFEDGAYNYSNSSYNTLNSSSNSIAGWTVASGSIDWINNYWQASDGTKSLDLAGLYQHGLIVSDPFTTVAGQAYQVKFDMAGNPDRGYAKTLVSVGAAVEGGSAPASHLFTFVQTGHTKADMGWVTQYFDFVAQSDLTQLFFGDLTGVVDPDGNPNEAYGAALDNVSVAPVPEPSTFLLWGAGLATVAMLRRRSSRLIL